GVTPRCARRPADATQDIRLNMLIFIHRFQHTRFKEHKDNCSLLIHHYSLFRNGTMPPAKLFRWDKPTGSHFPRLFS
ncbi:MAG: hypothetical protein M0Z50_13865, partial [Planctomycetia bacterium]|nr:hypothetical protein [Planctomycetia bacterium]